MPYIIDGHNLIPKIKGLSLKAIDDEKQLIELLQAFCRVRRQTVDVYFDGAPVEHAGTRRIGMITAHFMRLGKTADDGIVNRLNKLGRAAKNWVVVTSDRRVQVEARSCGASILTSEMFESQITSALRQESGGDKENRPMSDRELEEWLNLFKNEKNDP